MTTANLTRAETSRRAAAISDVAYRIELDLTGAADPRVPAFRSTTTIGFSAVGDSTWLDFIGESVESVSINGIAAPVTYDGARIHLTGLARTNTVVITALALYSRTGEGLHRFVDPVDDNTYLYTQYEPADARRVFANFEQPDIKAPFTFVVSAPEGWEVLSNERPVLGSGSGPVEFNATLPISTYITAIVAGPYHRVESSYVRGDVTIALGAVCRASLAEFFDADEIFDVTRRGLDFFHDNFEYPYPFGKYDQAFVPEYNLGAMENPGLVTFTEAYVFRSAATASQYEGRANTILHEMAHMWFGDLVTMVWWDDLWLKESFADYMGALASVSATQWTDAWVTFANRRKAWAYVQDQLPTTHPIVADITDLEAAKLNFDGITYAKGASALKQLAAFVGQDAFFAASRTYFAKHAFSNTRLADLLIELSAASGRDLTAWAAAWLQTTGVSTLSLADGVIHQTQPRPHRLAIGSYNYADDGSLVRTNRIETDIVDASTPIDLPTAALTLLNDDDLTYAKVRLDHQSLATAEKSLDRIVDPLARGLVWSNLWNAARDADMPASRYVEIVSRFAPRENNIGLLGSVIANARYALDRYIPRNAGLAAAWLDTSWHQLRASAPGSDAQILWARSVAAAAISSPDRATEIQAILAGTDVIAGLRVDHDVRWSFWLALSATGNASATELDAELASDPTSSGSIRHQAAMAARPEIAVKAHAWESVVESDSLSNEQVDAVITGFMAGGLRDLIAPYDDTYFDAIEGLWASRSIEIARRLVVGLFPQQESLAAPDAWLASHNDAPAALRRLVIEQRDHLARALRAREVTASGSI